MPIPIFKIFMVFGIVSAWAARALQDGKITLMEAADLASQLGVALGVPTDLTVPQQIVEVEKVVDLEEREEVEILDPVAEKLKGFVAPTPNSEGGKES